MNFKKNTFGLTIIFLLSLAACKDPIVDYKNCLNSYVSAKKTTPIYHNNFNIVQLSDLHWSTMTDVVGQREYLKNLIFSIIEEKGSIDLIELTGDQFMLFNMDVVKDLIDILESFSIPYAITWGNHDREGTAHPNWIIEQFKNAPHCLYTQVDNDNVYGTSNYVINLIDEFNVCKWQIVNLDSGTDYAKDSLSLGMTYDYIRQDQAEWWKAEHDLVGDDVPVIAYYHIPQYETELAWLEYKNSGESYSSKQKFFKYEGFGSCNFNKIPYFYNLAKDHGLKGIFMGHCHSNDWTTEYNGVVLGCGVKTGKELYYAKVSQNDASKVGINRAFDLVGASVVTLHDDSTFDLNHFYFDNCGFSKWVNF